MLEWFVKNPEVIKDLAINTSSTSTAVYTKICTTSEVTLNTELNTTDFYVFCDALQRHLITGANVSFSTTVKLDINNTAIQALLERVHTLLASGEIAQFNNQQIKFALLTGVSSTDNTLEYTNYTATANLMFEGIGGASESEAEFSLEIAIQGKCTEVTA